MSVFSRRQHSHKLITFISITLQDGLLITSNKLLLFSIQCRKISLHFIRYFFPEKFMSLSTDGDRCHGCRLRGKSISMKFNSSAITFLILLLGIIISVTASDESNEFQTSIEVVTTTATNTNIGIAEESIDNNNNSTDTNTATTRTPGLLSSTLSIPSKRGKLAAKLVSRWMFHRRTGQSNRPTPAYGKCGPVSYQL